MTMKNPYKLYRVTPRATCFMSGNCQWLTSQAQIEKELPNAIVRTEVLVTCPWITEWGKKVVP